jgi:UDP-N-acetylglucosamine--N-acetylmuramyl-(pentapeptide) pyrophosphoryl-undecaprenol N-acetylglucosamine transferase
VIAAGGTAGHVVPALAVADALRAQGVEVTFIGGERVEAQMVPAAGYPLRTISVLGLSRTNPRLAWRALRRAARATVRARRLLGELQPDAVMGGGGYVSGPVGLAALTRRIPLVLTEADSHLGLANRMLAPFARRVCLAFPATVAQNGEEHAPADGAAAGRGRAGRGPLGGRGPFARAHRRPRLRRRARREDRYRVTGRPVPPPQQDRAGARARLGIVPEETCVLVFGGSQGARSINNAALAAFAGATLHVLHICGSTDYPELVGRALPAGYDLREYLAGADFTDALAAADLVVARAGGSVFEIAAHGKPAILVPYPLATADHQAVNARWMEQGGAAVMIPDSELTAARLARETAVLLADPLRLSAMAAAARRLARPEAAATIAGELLAAAQG